VTHRELISLPKPFTEQYLIEELLRVHAILGRTPKTTELKIYKAPSKDVYKNRFGNYYNACIIAGIPVARTKRGITDEELLEILKVIYSKKGSPITNDDLGLDKGLPDPSTYQKRFGGVNKAANIAGVPSISHYNLSDEEMLSMLRDSFLKLGRPPHSDELSKLGLPSDVTFRTRFGSYTKALLSCGVTDRINYSGNYRGLKCLAEDGTVCLSFPELIITNFFIQNKVSFEKESHYPNSKYRTDWKVGDTFIEYFGLQGNSAYDEKIVKKRKICLENNIKLIEIYPKDIDALGGILQSVLTA
jgi:hypothetical protein